MDDGYAHFAIALIGLVDGMRLVPNGWTHFYKAAIEPCKLTDLVIDEAELGKVVAFANVWWQAQDSQTRTRMFGAIHWYCFSGAYTHEFEEFAAKYTVLDTLYWIHHHRVGGDRVRHACRAADLAAAYGMPVPPWAVVNNGSCRLADLRNELIHEGRFAGQPTGFAVPTEVTPLSLQLTSFLSRLILAMLQVRCGYVTTPATGREMHGLDLKA
jgi:hypothetical protein